METRILPCPEFDFWLHAIVTDDFMEVERRLSAVTPQERDVLLNGRFKIVEKTGGSEQTSSNQSRFKQVWGDVKISKPWNLAAICNASRVSLLFIR